MEWPAFWNYPFLPKACKRVMSSGSALAVRKLSVPKWTCEFCWILLSMPWVANGPIDLGHYFIQLHEDLNLEFPLLCTKWKEKIISKYQFKVPISLGLSSDQVDWQWWKWFSRCCSFRLFYLREGTFLQGSTGKYMFFIILLPSFGSSTL